jgi:hypothetical protein
MKSDSTAHGGAVPTQDSGLRTQDVVVVTALTVLVALSRFAALSRSIWDWDEGLFCLALRDYNVVFHHPHPPGFPLFIGAAKLIRLVAGDDFHALRAVSLIASMFVFPALYALARALRFPFRTSVIAALLFSFLPNVWYWGGTAFSDIFAVVLFLAGAALLLRDRYFLGSVLFAATLLVRPQNVLMAYPWFLASWRRRRIRDVLASAALIALLVLGGYGLAARATGGWQPFLSAARAHQRYVATVDGPLNPNRAAPVKLLFPFAIDPFHAGGASYLLCALAGVAFLRPRRRDLDVVLTFAPSFVLAWLMLSVTGASRFAVGYMPMHVLLAADGMGVIAAFVARRRELYLDAVFAAAIIGCYVFWIWPSLTEVRTHDAPPVAAARWIEQHVPRATGKVYVQGGMVPFADYFLAGYDTEEARQTFDPTAVPEEPNAVYLADRESRAPRAVTFRRPRSHLWALFNQRYFESSVVPVAGGPDWKRGKVDFAEGWYPEEIDKTRRPFRWMGSRGRILLEPLRQRGELSLQFFAPIDAESAPEVTMVINTIVVDRFRPTEPDFHRAYPLDSRGGAPIEVVISVDHAVNPARMGRGGDTRDLGLRVSGVVWRAVAP